MKIKTISKTYYVVVSIFAAILLFAMSCNNSAPKNSRLAQAERGKEIFMEQCASCHGAEGMEANAAIVDTLDKKPLDLTQINRRRGVTSFPIAEIAGIIDGRNWVKAHGERTMPVWGEVYEREGMEEGEIRGRKGELVAYLMGIQE